MRPVYAARYRDLYENHWWWRAREAFVLRVIKRYEPRGGFGEILDVGCGDGLFFDHLRAFGEPCGVDADESIVTEAGRRSGKIHIGKFDHDFHPGQRYGLILFLDVLEHLDDPVAALRHAKTLLRSNGFIIVTVPAFQILWTSHDDYNRHLRRYRKQHLSEQAREAKLEVVESKYFFHWLFGAKIITAMLERLPCRQPSPAEVPPRFLNSFLHSVCRFEHKLFARWNLGFGSSLLGVMRDDHSR